MDAIVMILNFVSLLSHCVYVAFDGTDIGLAPEKADCTWIGETYSELLEMLYWYL